MTLSKNVFLNLLESEGSQAAFDYLASCMPDYIYKFISLSKEKNDEDVSENEKRFKSLSEGKVWFSLRNVLNDPYEMKGFRFDKHKLMEYGLPEKSLDEVEQLMFQTPVASFTGNIEDNLPMWAHYSNNHRGFAIKYKVINKHIIRPVVYQDDIIDVSELFTHFLGNAIEVDKCKSVEALKKLEIYSTILQFFCFLKHKSWSYEKEYRIVFPLEKDQSVDYGLNIDTNQLGIEPIAVYSGINCADIHKERLQEITRKFGIEFYCCKQSNTKFTVVE